MDAKCLLVVLAMHSEGHQGVQHAAALAAITAAQLRCPTRFGVYNDGNRCRTYLWCRDFIPTRLTCPPALPFFNRQTRHCTNVPHFNCLQNNLAAAAVGGAGVPVAHVRQPSINQVQIAGAPGSGRLVPGVGGLWGGGLVAPDNRLQPGAVPNNPGRGTAPNPLPPVTVPGAGVSGVARPPFQGAPGVGEAG